MPPARQALIDFLQMIRLSVFFLFFTIFTQPFLLSAQSVQKSALFLGNSYTYVNNLPVLTAALAHYSGDSLWFGSHTPGGYTLGWQPIAHATDTSSLHKIAQGGWDFVILQEQSQTPAITRLRDSCMFPASIALRDSIKAANPCARVLFYLTWGRRFGGIQCFAPNYCSPNFTGFSQMQDSLTHSCKMIADSLAGWIAPAGEAWRYVITTTGMVLHDADDSHPNLKGSYLTACVFYDVIFGKPSAGNSFTAGLDPDTAAILQLAADSITFGYSSLWNLGIDQPEAVFTTQVSGDTLTTHNLSTGSGRWRWDFGDGQTSALFEPVHVYAAPGVYSVKLVVCNDCFCDSSVMQVSIGSVGIGKADFSPSGIRMTRPDAAGMVRFMGYSGDGMLVMYDLPGRTRLTVKVTAGRARLNSFDGSAGCWELKDINGMPIARGKFLNPPE
ncbi:MAG TPA: PKD domain-containing protein [Bacteroidales bacterium]|nr:PKD domain-containing protein [Bacteroidales bacterium]HPS62456.1 PKD domain-containing protein [Bacteroidales bacterium]